MGLPWINTQQSLSSLERHAENIGFDRLLGILAVVGVELVLRKAGPEEAASAYFENLLPDRTRNRQRLSQKR